MVKRTRATTGARAAPRKRPAARAARAPRHYHNCTNCGQPVSGKTALKAAAAAVKFCCGCGFQLRADGTCPRTKPACPFGGEVPDCG